MKASPLQLLRALPVAVATCAAVDTVLVRYAFDHRPTEAGLFLEACLLWLAFALAALAPAWLTLRLFGGGSVEGSPPRLAPAPVLVAWTALPVVLHARLDAFTSIGGDVSALRSPGPWLHVAGAALVLALAALGLSRAARAVPRGAASVAALVLATAAGLFVGFHDAPAGARQSGPAAASSDGRPNVLLLVWDTTRAKSLSFLDYDRETTPHLAELATTSTVFRGARSASNYTLTSHLSMLTGVYPSHHGARITRQTFNPMETPSVTERFLEAGYRTGAFVGTGVLRAQTGFAWGFEAFDDLVDPAVCDTAAWGLVHDVQSVLASKLRAFRRNGLPHWIQDYQRPADEVLARAGAWIRNGDRRPWFCVVNMYDVHWPYLPGESARERWVRDYDGPIDGYLTRSDAYEPGYELTDRDDAHLVDLYDGEMWELDGAVDRFLAGLDLDRTAVVVTSDHGEAFGEGGRYEHDDILECQLRIPQLVRPAGGSARREIGTPTSGVDVAPTLLALAGLEPEGVHAGRDLLGVLPDEARAILVEDRDHVDPTDVRLAYYEDGWKLVRLGLGERTTWALHELGADPEGLVDVAPLHPDVVARLRERLEAFRAAWDADDLRDLATGGDANIDALQALGYM